MTVVTAPNNRSLAAIVATDMSRPETHLAPNEEIIIMMKNKTKKKQN